MEYRIFKDLKISVLGQGTWQGSIRGWGKDYTVEDYIKGIKKSIELGVNFFDTAEIYGNGNSEKLLGKALSGYDRENIIVTTKIAPFNIKKWEKHLDRSLKNLNMKYVDIYQIHWPTPFYVNINKYLKEMIKAVENGKIRYIGVSNFYINDIEKIEIDIISDQIKYNILKKQLKDDEIEYLIKKGLMLIGYSPLEMGVLSGKYDYKEKPSGYLRKNLPYLKRDNYFKFKELMNYLTEKSRSYGYSMTQIALKYCIMKNVIPIYGSKNERQSEENANSYEVPLTYEDIKNIDELVKELNLNSISGDWSKTVRNLPMILQKIFISSFI